MRPRPVGPAADLELEHAQLDPDLERPSGRRGACTSRAMTSPGSGSYGQPWIASSKSRRIACSRTRRTRDWGLPTPAFLYSQSLYQAASTDPTA